MESGQGQVENNLADIPFSRLDDTGESGRHQPAVPPQDESSRHKLAAPPQHHSHPVLYALAFNDAEYFGGWHNDVHHAACNAFNCCVCCEVACGAYAISPLAMQREVALCMCCGATCNLCCRRSCRSVAKQWYLTGHTAKTLRYLLIVAMYLIFYIFVLSEILGGMFAPAPKPPSSSVGMLAIGAANTSQSVLAKMTPQSHATAFLGVNVDPRSAQNSRNETKTPRTESHWWSTLEFSTGFLEWGCKMPRGDGSTGCIKAQLSVDVPERLFNFTYCDQGRGGIQVVLSGKPPNHVVISDVGHALCSPPTAPLQGKTNQELKT